MPDTPAHRHGKPETARRKTDFVNAFVDSVKKLPGVQMVLLEGPPEDGPRIWTVLSAPPFDFSYRGPVYEAERRTYQSVTGVEVDFRLVNLQELEGPLQEILPDSCKVVFRRVPPP